MILLVTTAPNGYNATATTVPRPSTAATAARRTVVTTITAWKVAERVARAARENGDQAAAVGHNRWL